MKDDRTLDSQEPTLATIYVSGASDDLIEVAGAISLEGGLPATDSGVVTVNGVNLLTVTFDHDGLWRIEVIGQAPGVDVQVTRTAGEDAPRTPEPPHRIVSYSDYACLTGTFLSVQVPDDSWAAEA